MNTPTLLIVDDEKATRDGLRMALEEDFDCYVAADPTQAMNVLKSDHVDIMLTDLRMGAESGMDLLDKSQKLTHPPVAIMMTAYGSVDTAVEAMRRGAWHFVTKPLNLDEVEMLVKRASATISLKSKNQSLQEENTQLNTQLKQAKNSIPSGLDNLLGSSQPMAQLQATIKQVAPSHATVLIEGESGTGKELVAQAIHSLSPRASHPFITVNCAALSSQLLESELFGHEKGAFTGALQKRTGRIEAAHGGTLFLDEIGEIDEQTQVKLLRFLSERSIEKVGSNTSQAIDVRIITATNRNLQERVKSGYFREDLYYRLHVVKLSLPALRDRLDDLAVLTRSFLKEFSTQNKQPTKHLSPEVIELFSQYNWPGNIRELRACIEHCVIMSTAETIELKHCPSQISQVLDSAELLNHDATGSVIRSASENTLAESPNFNLHDLENLTIRRALQATDGNRSKAAELLGISRRTLQRKIKDNEDLH